MDSVLTDFAARIASASGDAGALLVLAIELAQENAGLAARAHALEEAETIRKADQAERKRRQRANGNAESRDVTGQDGTGRDVTPQPPLPPVSLLPPTPPNNSSSPPPPQKTRPRGKPAPWLPRFAAVWERRCGGTMPAERSVRALRRMVDMHGEDEAVRRWENYLAVTAPNFASAERFASTWAAWDKTPVHSTIAVAEDDSAWHSALDVVSRITRQQITAAEYRELPAPLQAALKSIGGWQAIRDAKQNDLPFRKRDFLAAYQSASTKVSA